MYYDNRKSWNNGIDTARLVEFLEKKGLLDDAMRIADKLLNGEIAAVGA